MTSRPPPIPPANRSDKGPGEPEQPEPDRGPKGGRNENPDAKGQQANTKVNTTHQGYQQAR